MQTAAGAILILLLLFSVRRLLFVLSAWKPQRSAGDPRSRPTVTLAAAFHNEEENLPSLLKSLDSLDYDRSLLSFCLIDDASTDQSAEIARAWIKGRDRACLIISGTRAGKAEALNRALDTARGAEIFAVFDADIRPRPDSLRRMTAAFTDPAVCAVSGYVRPSNAARNAVSAYASLEAWTHQLVNMTAKDNLDLNPQTSGGFCAYRFVSLDRAGGFPSGSFSEDVAVSLTIAGAGGRTRFLASAVCDCAFAETWSQFYRQRLRWSHGMSSSLPRARNLESVLVAMGYLDRVLLVLVMLFIAAGWTHPAWLAAYAAPGVAAVITAISRAGAPPRSIARLALVFPFLFPADIAVSVWAIVRPAIRRPLVWSTQRN